jgi:four helix bundle protein
MKDEKDTKQPFDLRERTKAFALRIIRMFVALPKTEEARVIGRQVLCSGTSVGANYREAHRSRSKAEFVAKIGDCLKELDEPSGARQTARQRSPKGERGNAHQTAYWLELLTESAIVPAPKLAPLQDECHQLIAILTTVSKKTKAGLQNS